MMKENNNEKNVFNQSKLMVGRCKQNNTVKNNCQYCALVTKCQNENRE